MPFGSRVWMYFSTVPKRRVERAHAFAVQPYEPVGEIA